MTLRIRGKTFEHRYRLQELGGVFDKNTKEWRFRHLAPHHVTELKSMVGCMVSGEANLPPSSPSPTFITRDIPDTPERIYNRDAFIPTLYGPVTHYGDDPTYLNYFAAKNPLTFFGFSGLHKFIEYIASLSPCDKAGWEPRVDFTGTSSMAEALDIARNGWSEGVEQAAELAERLTLANPRQRIRNPSVAGGVVNVGRLLSGHPLHMQARPKRPGKRVVTFYVEAGCSARINAETLIMRGAIVGAIVNIMENVGYSCTVVATDTSIYHMQPVYQLAVTLKEAGERLSLPDIIFALGHPSFLRRFSFAAQTSAVECRDSWRSLGNPADAFTERFPCRPDEFYIPVVETNDPEKLFAAIVPDNLPVEINL